MSISNDAATRALSPTAEYLIEALRPHTPFADAIVKRQAERAGLDLSKLTTQDVPRLVPMIVSATQVFVDPATMKALRQVLEAVK